MIKTKHAYNVHACFHLSGSGYIWDASKLAARFVECSIHFHLMRMRRKRRDIRIHERKEHTPAVVTLHTRSLRHCRLSTAFPRPVFLRASLSLANGTPLRDSLVAHRPMHSGERTCLLSHDNNDGDNWLPSLSAFHVSIGGREQNRRVLPRLKRLMKKIIISFL